MTKMPLPDIAPIKKGGEAATSTLNQMKAKQKGPTIYMIDPF